MSMKTILYITIILVFGTILTNCSFGFITSVTNKSDDTIRFFIKYKTPIIVVENTGKEDRFFEQDSAFKVEYVFSEYPILRLSDDLQKNFIIDSLNQGKFTCFKDLAIFEIYPHKTIHFHRIARGDLNCDKYVDNIEKIKVIQGEDTVSYATRNGIMKIFKDFNNSIVFKTKKKGS